MDDADKVVSLRERLDAARAEHSEALCRANRFRNSREHAALERAIRDVDPHHAAVCRLQSQLRRLLELPRPE